MDVGLIHSVFTVVLLIILGVIFTWALAGSQKKRFKDAAHLVFADEGDVIQVKESVR